MPGWLLCIHGFAFIFQPSNKSSTPGWSSLEESVHWGTDVNLTGLHQAPALNIVLLECFQDKWWRMAPCPLRLCLWTDHISASSEAQVSSKDLSEASRLSFFQLPHRVNIQNKKTHFFPYALTCRASSFSLGLMCLCISHATGWITLMPSS